MAVSSLTISDAVLPRSQSQTLNVLREIGLIVGFSILNAICAQISIKLPFTPVPITGQTFSVLLTGALLGSWRGGTSLLVYLAMGGFLPVYAGAGSFATLLSKPFTVGYLIAFPIAAFCVGLMAEHGWDKSVPKAVIAMIFGDLVIFLVGVPWLGVSLHIALNKVIPTSYVLQQGLIPFIPGEVIKIALASLLLPAGWMLLRDKKTAE